MGAGQNLATFCPLSHSIKLTSLNIIYLTGAPPSTTRLIKEYLAEEGKVSFCQALEEPRTPLSLLLAEIADGEDIIEQVKASKSSPVQ